MSQHYGLPDEAIEKIQQTFVEYPQIANVWLYGSRAMGNYRQGSDIDLCIEAPTLTMSQLLTIENQLDDLLLPWKMDLVLKHQVDNEALLAHVERVGVLFYRWCRA